MKYIKRFEVYEDFTTVRDREFRHFDWENLKIGDYVYAGSNYQKVINIASVIATQDQKSKLVYHWGLTDRKLIRVIKPGDNNFQDSSFFNYSYSYLGHFIPKEDWNYKEKIKKFNL